MPIVRNYRRLVVLVAVKYVVANVLWLVVAVVFMMNRFLRLLCSPVQSVTCLGQPCSAVWRSSLRCYYWASGLNCPFGIGLVDRLFLNYIGPKIEA